MSHDGSHVGDDVGGGVGEVAAYDTSALVPQLKGRKGKRKEKKLELFQINSSLSGGSRGRGNIKVPIPEKTYLLTEVTK